MQDELSRLRERALAELKAIDDLRRLDEWRVNLLGKKGALTQVLRGLAALPLEERRTVGAIANQMKVELEETLAQRQAALKEADVARAVQTGAIDVTLPGRPIGLGRLHPVTQVVREICSAFVAMGFEVAEGPEVEWDYYNFEALNMPAEHPAREMWDTLWIDQVDEAGRRNMLLRTHTSPVQIRVMENTQPPIRIVIPGKCYRYEATDATHEWHFQQVEGLAVDKGITFADLKGTLQAFARRLLGEERKTRFRCDYFPFVEPGAEMAVDCFLCKGAGCRVCSYTGWIEILGAGMVHPDIIRRVGYDPDVYTGFAFGMGVERVVLLRHQIDDIRLFYQNDLRFLRQF